MSHQSHILVPSSTCLSFVLRSGLAGNPWVAKEAAVGRCCWLWPVGDQVNLVESQKIPSQPSPRTDVEQTGYPSLGIHSPQQCSAVHVAVIMFQPLQLYSHFMKLDFETLRGMNISSRISPVNC
jgi:hypothetical protein